jgi:hypothetical protein
MIMIRLGAAGKAQYPGRLQPQALQLESSGRRSPGSLAGT